MSSIPDASGPVVRDAFVVLRFEALHRVIQKEVDQDGVDPVCLRVFVNVSGLPGVLGSSVSIRLGDALPASGFHLGMPFLDFALDQLHAPDTCPTELNLPI